MMNWNADSTAGLTFNYNTSTDTCGDSTTTCNYITLSTPDPLIDWLPNSCLYTKYVPTWHLVRSYK